MSARVALTMAAVNVVMSRSRFVMFLLSFGLLAFGKLLQKYVNVVLVKFSVVL